jgi:hypothetical protein
MSGDVVPPETAPIGLLEEAGAHLDFQKISDFSQLELESFLKACKAEPLYKHEERVISFWINTVVLDETRGLLKSDIDSTVALLNGLLELNSEEVVKSEEPAVVVKGEVGKRSIPPPLLEEGWKEEIGQRIAELGGNFRQKVNWQNRLAEILRGQVAWMGHRNILAGIGSCSALVPCENSIRDGVLAARKTGRFNQE